MTRSIVSIIFVAACSSSAWAQSISSLIFNPELNEIQFLGEASTTRYEDTDVDDQETEFELTEYYLRFGLRLRQTERSEWFLTGEYLHWDIDTEARFEESFLESPDDLSDFNLGVGYRRFLDNDWLLGAHVRGGSASDELFDSSDEMYLKADLFLRKPVREKDGWLFLLNVNTDRDLPVLPGVAYQFVRDDLQAIVGIPIVDLRWQMAEKWNLSASYLPVHRMSTQLTYSPARFLNLFARFEWNERYFRRADRRDDDDRIEYDEKRLVGGADVFLSKNVGLRLSGGYAFDRAFGEGEDRSDRRDNEFEPDDGWFVGFRVGARF